MNKDQLRLSAAVDVTGRAVGRLGRSLAIDLELLRSAIRIPDAELDDEQLRALDAFVQRFEQVIEHMTHRLYPALYRLETFGDRPPPPRTLFTKYEAAQLLDAKAWGEYIELRNRLVHEYPVAAEDRANELAAALDVAKQLQADFERVIGYIESKALYLDE